MKNFSLAERPGYLRLHGQPGGISFSKPTAFVGRRQTEWWTTSIARMEFAPKIDGERAGLTVLMSPAFHYDLCETAENGKLFVELVKQVGDMHEVTSRVPVSAGPVMLRIESDPLRYQFAFAAQDGIWHEVGTGEVNLLAPELANVWTGMYIGMFSASSPSSATPADFDWFDYHAEDREKR
jgi:alpha-N-arabinofuranosidase